MVYNNKSGKIFTIVGALGFLGQYITREILLSENVKKIRMLDRKNEAKYYIYDFNKHKEVEFIQGDVLKPLDLTKAFEGSDVVINCAGIVSFCSRDSDAMYDVNVTGAINVAKVACKMKVPMLIHISSVAAIGYLRGYDGPVNEELKVNWSKYKKKHYMYTKRLGEDNVLAIGRDLKQNENTSVIVVNPAVMYGKGDCQNTIDIFKFMLQGGSKIAPPGGTALAAVNNVAKGIVCAIRHGKNLERYILADENLAYTETMKLVYKSLVNAGINANSMKVPKKILPKWFRHVAIATALIIERFSKGKPALTVDEACFGFIRRYYSSRKSRVELHWISDISVEDAICMQANWLISEGYIGRKCEKKAF
jgi:dihydroflavonol-4-reductase